MAMKGLVMSGGLYGLLLVLARNSGRKVHPHSEPDSGGSLFWSVVGICFGAFTAIFVCFVTYVFIAYAIVLYAAVAFIILTVAIARASKAWGLRRQSFLSTARSVAFGGLPLLFFLILHIWIGSPAWVLH
jgi:hypothetical protein